MKQIVIPIALIVFISAPAYARSTAKKEVGKLVKQFADAYQTKTLDRIDRARSYPGKVRVVIAHSLAEDSREITQVKTFKAVEQWLKSREREDGTPFRESRPLLRCGKGVCTFNLDGGIDHNHLYLQRITYGYRNGSLSIKTIFLLDGD